MLRSTFAVTVALLLPIVALCAGCDAHCAAPSRAVVLRTGPRPAPARTPSPVVVAPAPIGRGLIAAFGSQGPVPCTDAACLDRLYRMVAVFEIEEPSGPSAGWSLARLEVLDDDGRVQSESRELVDLVRLSNDPLTEPLLATTPGWAGGPDVIVSETLTGQRLLMTEVGTPFDGTLQTGRNRLRVQCWLTHQPTATRPRFRITLSSERGTVVSEGASSNVQWGTA